jgi:peptidoglycan/LPS O-acetylase OafA/YrhL
MTPSRGRFSFIDGLRGLAALAVVLPHSRGLFYFPENNIVCRTALNLSVYGGRGVQLFFVISGFAIAYSLRNETRESFRLGVFVLRRGIRLDPPYWTGIFAMWAALAAQSLLTHRPVWIPAPSYVLAHMFYLQEILGLPPINVVFWTLCIEFQLYIAFALLLVVSERLASGEWLDTALRPALVIGCFLVSLVLSHTIWPNDGPGPWFIPYWYMFLGGVLLCWHMLGRVSGRQLALCAACALVALAWHPDSFKLSALLAALAIYVALRRGKLSTWLSGRRAQWLGRMSYSIYLLHVPLALIVLGIRTRVAAKSNILPFVMLAFLYVLILAASHFLYVWVERPCLALAGRLKQRAAAVRTEPAT